MENHFETYGPRVPFPRLSKIVFLFVKLRGTGGRKCCPPKVLRQTRPGSHLPYSFLSCCNNSCCQTRIKAELAYRQPCFESLTDAWKDANASQGETGGKLLPGRVSGCPNKSTTFMSMHRPPQGIRSSNLEPEALP